MGFRAELRFDETELRRVRQPTLLIWADHDPVGDVQAARQTAALLPNARLEVLPTGHTPFWESLRGTGELASRFLDDEANT